ncbi:trafficking protein particle complex subunit 6b [Condylostylus longicornis]|uniref:trafficking protein particle complex subunit 6b n=1 Tax=Condylostylus longicornis TaxID=2530218 RepID=UPI00244E5A2E|nr:trafficking protein particle complex subunit 6b [Condylostylus longicornis]
MSSDSIFEYLHSEIVNYSQFKSKNQKDLTILDSIGFTTGFRLIERLTREVPRFDELEAMKFICTDFWTVIYKKQIDNLRTNHHGVYVLQDNSFRFLTRLSSCKLEHAPKYVAFTCGLIRGSLANLGISSTVTAEVGNLPSCKFHVQVNRKNV